MGVFEVVMQDVLRADFDAWLASRRLELAALPDDAYDPSVAEEDRIPMFVVTPIPALMAQVIQHQNQNQEN